MNHVKPEWVRLSHQNDPNATRFTQNRVHIRKLEPADYFTKHVKFWKKGWLGIRTAQSARRIFPGILFWIFLIIFPGIFFTGGRIICWQMASCYCVIEVELDQSDGNTWQARRLPCAPIVVYQNFYEALGFNPATSHPLATHITTFTTRCYLTHKFTAQTLGLTMWRLAVRGG